jgi:peroxiredoxin
MKQLTRTIAAAVVAQALAASVFAAGISTGDAAPDFTLKDPSGKEHSLSGYKGKFVVLEWTNFECPFVKKHYSGGSMQALQEKFTADEVVWLSICSSGPEKQGHMTAEEAAQKIAKNDFAATAYLIDEEGKVGKEFGAKTTPHMFVINPEGKVIYQGAIDSIRSADSADIAKADNYVAQCLEAGKAGKEISVGTTKPYGCGVKY